VFHVTAEIRPRVWSWLGGDEEWNATCAFANIYHMADSSAPTAFVVKDSLQAKSFETLPKLTYYGTYKGNDPLQIKTFASIWPVFIGLTRMGLRPNAPFHPFLTRCNSPDETKVFGKNNPGEKFNADIYRALSLENSLSVCRPGSLGLPKKGQVASYRFPIFVYGSGHMEQ